MERMTNILSICQNIFFDFSEEPSGKSPASLEKFVEFPSKMKGMQRPESFKFETWII